MGRRAAAACLSRREGSIIEHVEVLAHGAPRIFRRSPVLALDTALTIGVSLDHAAVDRKALATDQAFVDATLHHGLEQTAQQVAVAEAAMAVLREGRVIRDFAVETKPQNQR